MIKLLTKLNGKKTYLIACGIAVYGWGITKQVWPHSALVDACLAGGTAATIRHAISTTLAKAVMAALTDPPQLPTQQPVAAEKKVTT